MATQPGRPSSMRQKGFQFGSPNMSLLELSSLRETFVSADRRIVLGIVHYISSNDGQWWYIRYTNSKLS